MGDADIGVVRLRAALLRAVGTLDASCNRKMANKGKLLVAALRRSGLAYAKLQCTTRVLVRLVHLLQSAGLVAFVLASKPHDVAHTLCICITKYHVVQVTLGSAHAYPGVLIRCFAPHFCQVPIVL